MYPPDPIYTLCKLPGKQISDQYRTYPSVQISKILLWVLNSPVSDPPHKIMQYWVYESPFRGKWDSKWWKKCKSKCSKAGRFYSTSQNRENRISRYLTVQSRIEILIGFEFRGISRYKFKSRFLFNLNLQLTKISPPFRISICISFTISSLIFQGTGCSGGEGQKGSIIQVKLVYVKVERLAFFLSFFSEPT